MRDEPDFFHRPENIRLDHTRKRGIVFRIIIPIMLLVTGLAVPSFCSAAEGTSFYTGKQITLVIGTGAGGGFDLYGRVLVQYLQRHIPGKPMVVAQNQPGAEGVIAASYIYSVAPKDGTVIAICPSAILLAEALTGPQVHFDSTRFGWIGTMATTTDLLAVFKSTGVDTIEDARKREVIIGATGQFSLSAMEPAIANALLGTKFRIVKGYTGGGEAFNVAMERHEIEGRTNQWASWKVLRPDWIRDGQLSYLLQFGPRDPGLPSSVPTLDELVATPEDKAMADLLEITQYMGRSIFAPPNIPDDRLAMLRHAFDETMADPDFIAKMNDLNLELIPQQGTKFQQTLARVMGEREKVVPKIKAVLNLP